MEQQPLSSSERIPRLNQCYLCKAWQLESNLQAIEVPDQGSGYIRKLACKKCLGPILSASEGIK
jgi:hypothetical protein